MLDDFQELLILCLESTHLLSDLPKLSTSI